MTIVVHPLVDVVKQFTIDWLNKADASVPPKIMTPGYRVHIGDTELDGLQDYAGGTIGQLQQFPGLTLTVHDLVTDGDRVALVFTEHGASTKTETSAAWAGVALFRWDGSRLTENWTQEDYYARRRQLAGPTPDVIRAPAPAPWTTNPAAADPASEAIARKWLAAPSFVGIHLNDGLASVGELDISVTGVTVHELFSAGHQVAFAASWTGNYSGGLEGAPNASDHVRLGAAGVLTVDGEMVVGGAVVTDRLGLRKTLLPPR